MSTTRKLLTSLLVVGMVSAVIGAGTFATFSAQTSNANNTFATGTLVLSNTVNAGTACLSTAGGSTDTNVNDNCSAIFNVSAQKPGATPATANLTLKNEGSIDISALKGFSAAACAASDTAAAHHGTGNPCDSVQLTIQAYDSGFTTPGACLYGGTSCAFDSSKTLTHYSTTYTSASNGVSLGALTAGSSVYLKISVQMPSSGGNSYQGRAASVAFSWNAVQ